MRGDFNTLSPRLQERHLKNTKSLNKVTVETVSYTHLTLPTNREV